MDNSMSSLLHFKLNRVREYLSFWIRLPYHVIIHRPTPNGLDYNGWDIRGFIICNCGYVVDLGVSYGLHCDGCYNRIRGSKQKGD